ncbi:MAG: glycosyltransferase family 4 protein [Deinococcota bacterium]
MFAARPAGQGPLKLAHLTSTFPPYWAGTGNVAFHNARILHERGHDITLFTARYSANDDLPMPFKTERLETQFRVGNAPLTLSLLRKLRGADLIHLHYPYIFGAELASYVAWRDKIPLVLTYHNQLQEQTALKKTLFSIYNALSEPIILGRAARRFAVSREHFSSLHPRFDTDVHTLELPNGVDTTSFCPQPRETYRAQLGVASDVPVALFVGALDQAHRFKNVDGLLRAFKQLSAEPQQDAYDTLASAQLWIVGDGDLRPELEALSQQLELTDRVRFLGKHPPTDLPPIYSAADVLVLPSTGVESFGVVLIEALACATAVVASSLPGVRTVVDDSRDGLLVPPGDEPALAAALGDLLRDRGRTAAMGQSGRSKVQARYDWQVIGKLLEDYYYAVLEP